MIEEGQDSRTHPSKIEEEPQQSPRKLSNTQRLTGIALFVSVAVILNLVFHIPAPFAPFLQFEVWEIPLVLALLVYGFRAGFVVAIVNTIILFFINPGPIPAGPFYNLAAVMFTFGGLLAGQGLAKGFGSMPSGIVASATAFAVGLRVAGMTAVNYFFVPQPPPIGFGIGFQAVVPLLPAIALFNALVALYTVPLSYAILRQISLRYRVAMAYQLQSPRIRKSQ